MIFSIIIFANNNNFENDKLDPDQVFRRGNFDEPDTLDPQKAFAAPDYNILSDLYEGLMTFDKDGKIALGQAKSYHVSENGLIYTFTLRDNLKWSNGESLTAYDFEYGIKRACDPNVGSQNYILLKNINNCEEIINGKLPIDKLGVKALDQQTLRIKLNKPIPYLISLLTHNTFAPVYRPNVIKYGDKFTDPNIYVTNGPFKLKDWVVNSHLALVKNHYYRDSSDVLLKQVIYYPINQQSVELSRFRAGDIDYTAKVPVEKLSWIKNKLGKELYSSPMLAAYYYTFNLTTPPFANNNYLRKALSLVIDKDIIADKILGGRRTATDRFVPGTISNYLNLLGKDLLTDYTQQLDLNNAGKQNRLKLALEYYQKAGYSKTKPLKTKLLFHTNESNKIIATAVASMWRKELGIQTELVDQEWKVFLKSRLEHHDTEVVREGWIASYDDPSSFLDLFSHNNPQNSSGYFNQKFESLLNEADSQKDVYKRADLLFKAEEILLDDAPVIPIYNPISYHLVKPYVKGVNINSFDLTKSQYVYITNA